jgi:hypothetical protein
MPVEPIPQTCPGVLGLRCRVGQTLRRRLLAVGRRVAERAVTADIFAAVAAFPVMRGGEDPRAALDVVVDALDGRCVRGDHWLPRSPGIRLASHNLSRSTTAPAFTRIGVSNTKHVWNSPRSQHGSTTGGRSSRNRLPNANALTPADWAIPTSARVLASD